MIWIIIHVDKKKWEKKKPMHLSPIRIVIVSHMDVCKNTFKFHLSDKTPGFRRPFIHSGGASSALLMWQVI